MRDKRARTKSFTLYHLWLLPPKKALRSDPLTHTLEIAIMSNTEISKNPQTEEQTVEKATVNYKAIGKADAKEIQDKLGTVEAFQRKRILERAKQYAGMPSGDDWLEGYSKYWVDPNTSKFRKREAKAVFDAWSKPGSGYTLKEAREKLEMCQLGYHAFIQLAVTIRGKKAGGKSSTKGIKVTPKQFDAIEKGVTVMSRPQVQTLVAKAVGNVAKLAQGDITMCRIMLHNFVPALLKSDDVGIRKFADYAEKRLTEILEAFEEQEKAKAGMKQEVNGINAPTAKPEATTQEPEVPTVAEAGEAKAA